MESKGFGLKVLIGILVGAAVGVLLMFATPVGIQPGDTLRAIDTQGNDVELKVGDDAKNPTALVVDGQEIGEPVKVVGLSLNEAVGPVAEQTGLQIQSIEVADRGSVAVRPTFTEIIYVIGQIFLRLLKMIVIPLVIATVFVGIASLGNIKALGKLGGQTAGFYIGTMLIAVTIGIIWVNLLSPGTGLQDQWASEAGTAAVADQTAADLILKTIPTNPIAAITNGDIVGVLFFVILVALAVLSVGKRRAAPFFNFMESLNDLVFVLIGWIMRLAPIGVGALLAHTIATQDMGFLGTLLQSLGLFALTVVGALLTHWIVLLVIVGTLGKYNPIKFVKNMAPAFGVAFGSNSSSATMPVTLECVKEMGVSKRVRNFVVPVGATLNMDGTALFEAVSVLFFAQAFGMIGDVGIGGQLVIAITAVVAAIGAAGIPSAGLVTMVIVLQAAGIPASKIEILWGIDRPLDMCRTVVNITGDAVTSRFIQTINPDIDPALDDEASEYAVVDPEASHGD